MMKHELDMEKSRIAADFVQFSIDAGVLRFGEFKTKAGRLSPYFFNAGLFDDGAKLQRLAEFYARSILAAQLEFDVIFGPAYKGIVLAAATAVELARLGRPAPFAYNRKEAKDHGEGGQLVGAPLAGRVLIIDDVMSAGTAVRESIALIRSAGAVPAAVAVALDRQEMATDAAGQAQPHSAVQFVRRQLGLEVVAIATLDDLLAHLQAGVAHSSGGAKVDLARGGADGADLAAHRDRVLAYRAQWGVRD